MKQNSKKKKKAARNPGTDRYRSVSVTPRFYVWLVLWIAALIFTQALLSTASHIFFLFVTLFPVCLLIYALLSRPALKIFMVSDSAVTEKQTPFTYDFRIINEYPLPFPFIDAYLMLPQSNSVRCSERCVKVSMSPDSSYTVHSTVQFRFRGTYEIGVCCFYVYDFFRLFRVRIDVDSYDTVYVLPRKLVLDTEEAQAVSDSVTRTRRAPNSYDKLEVSDIRDYRLGDTLKSIHWKLSSKSEELVVREYNTGSTDITYIFVDFSAHFPDHAPEKPFVDPYLIAEAERDALEGAAKTAAPVGTDTAQPAEAAPDSAPADAAPKKGPRGRKNKKKKAADEAGTPAVDVSELINDEAYEDMNEYCADGIVELAISAILREIRAGREVCVVWFDKRSDIDAFSFNLHTQEDFDLIFRLFATAPLVPAEKNVARLYAMVQDTQDAKQLFVIPTVDDETVSTLCQLPCASDGAAFGGTEVIAYAADERYAHPALRSRYIEGCRAQLSDHGLKLIDGKLDEVNILASESPLTEEEKASGGASAANGLGFGLTGGRTVNNGR